MSKQFKCLFIDKYIMSKPSYITEQEWSELCKPDEDVVTEKQYIDVNIPFKLHQLARDKYGMKYNPAKNTNFAPIEYKKMYQINYLTNFTKYSKRLNEKFTWDKVHGCYYWVGMEGEQ